MTVGMRSASRAWRRTSEIALWLASHELGSLLGLGTLAVGLWGFIGISEEIGEGDTRIVDRALLLALRSPTDLADPIGPPWLEEMGRDLTALGGVELQILSWAILLTFLVGLSRVYVGVHWPSDVCAGWAMGAAWASLSLLTARSLQRRGHRKDERHGV